MTPVWLPRAVSAIQSWDQSIVIPPTSPSPSPSHPEEEEEGDDDGGGGRRTLIITTTAAAAGERGESSRPISSHSYELRILRTLSSSRLASSAWEYWRMRLARVFTGLDRAPPRSCFPAPDRQWKSPGWTECTGQGHHMTASYLCYHSISTSAYAIGRS